MAARGFGLQAHVDCEALFTVASETLLALASARARTSDGAHGVLVAFAVVELAVVDLFAHTTVAGEAVLAHALLACLGQLAVGVLVAVNLARRNLLAGESGSLVPLIAQALKGSALQVQTMSIHVAPGALRAWVHLSAHLAVALETSIARAVVGERDGSIHGGTLGIQRAHAPVNSARVNGRAARSRAAALIGSLATARVARAADALDTRTTLGAVGQSITATMVHRTETRIDTCLAVARETFIANASVLGGAKKLALRVL